MARSVELLLLESVENQGIVGDVIKARLGYARNYLLPRNLATVPSPELIQSLQSKRAEAEKQMAQLRQQRSEIITKLTGYELTIERSCNDQGILYGSVTQQEIAAALVKSGFAVRPRDVRLSGAIKRVDNYDIHIKYETELETTIKLHVKADRVLSKDEKPDLDFDMEGNLVEKRAGKKPRNEAEAGAAEGTEAGDKGEKRPKADKTLDAKEPKAEKKPSPAAAEEEPAKKATKKPREDVKKPAKDAKKA